MKPPARTRCLPSRLGENEPNAGGPASSNAKTESRPDLRCWTLREKQNVHRELRIQRAERQKERAGTAAPGGDAPARRGPQPPQSTTGDPDMHRLLRRLPKRNEHAVFQMLQYLKEMVLWETKRASNSRFEHLPEIEVWCSLAERATGSLNEQITDAFARVFMVAANVACDDVTKSAALAAQNKQGLQPQRSGMAEKTAGSFSHDGGRASETSGGVQGATSMQEAAQKLDYENIYLFLHDAFKAKDKISAPQLSPLESAVVLDLLLSLPEEIGRREENLQWKDLQTAFSKIANPVQRGTEVPTVIEGEMEDGECAPLNPFALSPSLAMLNISKQK